jgi:hypothetical protein
MLQTHLKRHEMTEIQRMGDRQKDRLKESPIKKSHKILFIKETNLELVNGN